MGSMTATSPSGSREKPQRQMASTVRLEKTSRRARGRPATTQTARMTAAHSRGKNPFQMFVAGGRDRGSAAHAGGCGFRGVCDVHARPPSWFPVRWRFPTLRKRRGKLERKEQERCQYGYLFFIVYNQCVVVLHSKYAFFGLCLLHGFCPISGLNLKTGPTNDP